jgi:hypothetical protein
MHITGTVVYQDLEGGFWAIVGDDGTKYQPVNGLPPSVQREGCRVEADVEPSATVSFLMWGKPVTILSLDRL